MAISDTTRSLGEILLFSRKSRGLTIKELEKKSGVSASFISRIENDSGNPSVEVVRKLAQALGMPLSDFFDDHKGGKVLYPLRLGQARLLKDPAVLEFLDNIRTLTVEERRVALSMTAAAISMLRSTLVPLGDGLYRLAAEETPPSIEE